MIEYCQIELTHGQVARVSAEDFEELSRYRWYAIWRRSTNSFYAARKGTRVNGKSATILMHRQIMEFPRAMQVDHTNGNTLDNRRSNLRPATNMENSRNSKMRSTNTSGFKGICQDRKTGRWRAEIRAGSARVKLGYFATPEEAHAAYCVGAKKYHGEFARTA